MYTSLRFTEGVVPHVLNNGDNVLQIIKMKNVRYGEGIAGINRAQDGRNGMG